MGSNWNTLMTGLARVGLGQHEQRVLAAIVRLTLGYRKTSDKLPISQLVGLTGLDRRHVSRALEELQARKIITRSGGARGRGHTATVTLNLNVRQWAEKSPGEATNKTRLKVRLSEPVKVASPGTKKSPHEAHSKGKGVKHPAPSAENDLRRLAFDAYLSTGGTLTLDRERGALARGVTALAKRGTEQTLVLAACRDLGRKREFPGLLTQRVKELAENGGPCEYEGLDRARMTIAQLDRCGCARCAEWIDALRKIGPSPSPSSSLPSSENPAHARGAA